ncbi:hypothetical protein KVR01_009325 [Diaporthe batatas]|uniref:uncharacterized protein n=1 Tax=Diaporthe batatas TaxID=748121 RepID=UPI001D049CCC|nr:uncharacterized protein KVR01_009325 [Diaporthe batatas]KAG8161061.1 hypothetical protein KVR01_009325 [Diaporthe batatas]
MKADRNRESSAELCGGSILVANPMAPPSPTPSHQSPPSPRTTTSSSADNHKTPPPPRRRGTVACRRCRRLRTKCLHGPESNPPCEACRSAGPQTASECSFPRRGEKDVDRDFRRRQPAHRLSVSSSSASQGTPSLNLSAPAVQPLPGGLTMPVDAPIFSPGLAAASSFGTASHHQHQHQHQRQHQRHHHSASSSSSSFSTTTPRFFSNPTTYASMSRRRQGSSSVSPSSSSPSSPPSPFFPPHEEIVAGCRSFVTSYFQLGFLPKAVFIEAISRSPGAVSPFLLSCILCVSARFTPALAHRYGGAGRATDNFLRLARAMVPAEMYEPSLERTQGFFLLAIAEWGNGDKDRSSVDMGVAVRMASILKLHREESYALAPGAPAEQVIRAESARRTFWMIHSQENLHAGYSSPAPFPPEDITARLPCDEHDFAFGVSPESGAPRSVLPGTLPALLHPDLARSPDRCLFATLVQSHNLWGQVARRACRSDLKTHGTEPWEPGSEYQELTRALRRFEAEMPERHRWSGWNLRGWRSEGLHLAYLAVVMVLRVSNIVERRIYLDEILLSANSRGGGGGGGSSSSSSSSITAGVDTTEVSPDTTKQQQQQPSPATGNGSQAPEGFWRAMSDELFAGVVELHEQIDAFASLRANNNNNNNNSNTTSSSPQLGEGFPAILVFCVYICGSLASYLWRYPQLCPRAAPAAEAVSLRCLQVLGDLHRAWPTSTRWQQGLQQIASPLSAAAASASASSSGSTSSSRGGRGSSSSGGSPSSCATSVRSAVDVAAALDESIIDPRLTAASSLGGGGAAKDDDPVASFWAGAGADEAVAAAAAQPPAADADAMSNELFEAEMRNLLSEDVQFGWLDFEHGGGE